MMMLKPAFPITAILLLAGCATPVFVSPVEVTRFAAPVQAAAVSPMQQRGTITLAPAAGTDAATAEYRAQAEAVAIQLAALGYRVVAQDGAQVAQISLVHSVTPAESRSPISVAGNGSVGSYGSGVGLGIGLDLTPRRGEVVTTRLAVSIRAATGESNIWEGRASMSASANSDFAAPDAAAARLAGALFRGFPGTSGETILVP